MFKLFKKEYFSYKIINKITFYFIKRKLVILSLMSFLKILKNIKIYLSKYLKYILLFIMPLVILNSCRFPDNFGFFQPMTLDLKVPDGPPEFKAGWHNGCRSALGMRVFANSYIYQDKRSAEFGSGVYQHDQTYNSAWSNAFFVCSTYVGTFVDYNSMKFSPLQ
jgi:hypothetical protein